MTSGLDAVALHTNGAEVSATVLEVHNQGSSKSQWMRVEFTTPEGDQVITVAYRFLARPTLTPGDQVYLIYDQDDPYGNVVDRQIGREFEIPVMLGLSALLSAGVSVVSFGRVFRYPSG